MRNWHLIEKQPLLSEIYKNPPLVSYKRGCSLKDIHSWEPNYEKVACEQALSAARSRVLARLASFAQVGELARRLWKGYFKHALGSRVGLSTPLYTKSVLKCNWHAFLMFSSDGSWSRGTRVNSPILEYFWHLPCTWLDNLCTVIPWLPPAAAAPSPCNCPSFVSFSTCCTQKCGTGDWLK